MGLRIDAATRKEFLAMPWFCDQCRPSDVQGFASHRALAMRCRFLQRFNLTD